MYNTCDNSMTCEPKVPTETMVNVIGETREITTKLNDIAFYIRTQLFGSNPNNCVKNERSITCAYDVLLDTREIILDTLRILDEIRSRIIN